MVQVRLIKFSSLDAINGWINSLEMKRNKMRYTPYNGFNFEDSFVNHAKASQIDSDIEYLKTVRKNFLK